MGLFSVKQAQSAGARKKMLLIGLGYIHKLRPFPGDGVKAHKREEAVQDQHLKPELVAPEPIHGVQADNVG